MIEHGDPCRMRKYTTLPRWLIARVMSEGDVNDKAAKCLRVVDEVWVPTQWHRDKFSRAGVNETNIFIIPEPINTSFWSQEAAAAHNASDVDGISQLDLNERERLRAKVSGGGKLNFREKKALAELEARATETLVRSERYTFFSNFKWEQRKGWDLLLDAYWREFEAGEILTPPYPLPTPSLTPP